MKTVGLIVAAGLSERMGKFKPLLPVGGKTMIEQTISIFQQTNISDVFVVIGNHANELTEALKHTNVHFVLNEAYATSDMFTSVRLGLEQIAEHTDAQAVFLLPADMPAVPPMILGRLLDRMETQEVAIVFPSKNMRRLHPPLLHRRCFNAITEYRGEDGLRGAFRSLDESIAYVETDDEGCSIDVDTPEDYRRLLRHMREVE